MSKYLDQDGLLYLWQKLKTKFAGKVDVVEGKGLSTNDYTTTEKNKLAGIAEGANNYVHPSYTARTGKPTANATPAFGGTVTVSQITSDALGHVTGATDRTITIPATAMGGASSSAAGSTGLVPAPAKGDQEKFLRGDGNWVAASVEDTKVNVTLATTSKAYVLGTTTTPTSTAAGTTAVADTGVYLDTTAGKLTATSFAGNGADLTNLNAANIATGIVPEARLPKFKAPRHTSSGDTEGVSGIVTPPSSVTTATSMYYFAGDGTWQMDSDERVRVALDTTSKAYLLATTTAPVAGSTGQHTAVADTGVYLDTTAGRLTAGSFSGNGANLTSLNASNLGSGTVPAARLPVATSSANGAMSSTDKAKLDAFGAASTYALKTDITSMYKHKGSVATTNDLPATGNTEGDVYNVTSSGMNYVWVVTSGTGSWDALGEVFTIDSITNAEIDTILAA